MRRSVSLSRTLLVLAILAGLLLPLMGTVLAWAAGFETVVICRGDALVTLTLDTDGRPVETELRDHGPCLAAALPDAFAMPEPAWVRLMVAPTPVQAADLPLPPAGVWSGPPPERGPPGRMT